MKEIMNSNILIAITSVCAVVISIISMVFTVIFSAFQHRHNKNSVRPISAIRLSDYEDRLAVTISNVGTGPLTIIRLRLIRDSREYPTLIEMMPHVNQTWTTFTECVDGWTIPVGGKLTLLEIDPEINANKERIREALAPISVSLDYADIYKTKFHDQRALDFFGRHQVHTN